MGRRPAAGPPPAVPARACTGSPRPRRRAARCTRSPGPAARCSPPTPTPTRPWAASPRRWRTRWASPAPGRCSRPRPRRWTSWSCSCRRPTADRVRAALAEAGAGRIGDYDQASFSSAGEGRFRPLDGAAPTVGEVGRPEVVDEVRVEVVLPRRLRGAVVARGARRPSLRGAGLRRRRARRPRPVGHRHRPDRRRRADDAAASFAGRVAAALPATAQGVRVAGDPDRVVRRVALCGGAGDFLLDAVPRHRRRRLRHQRPAPPPGGGVPRARRPGAGRRRPLGGGVDLAAGGPGATGRSAGRYGGDPGEHAGHRPLAVPHLNPRSHTLKADPFAQLKLLDVQELDSRADQLRHQRPTCPSTPRSSSSPRAAPTSTTAPATRRSSWRT